jgi:hypothetical protein
MAGVMHTYIVLYNSELGLHNYLILLILIITKNIPYNNTGEGVGQETTLELPDPYISLAFSGVIRKQYESSHLPPK